MMQLDPDTFEDVFHAHAPRLALYARQWLDAAAAEDVVQEVFIRLGGLPKAPDATRAWLFRSVRNAAISELRSRQRRAVREQAATQDSPMCFTPHPDDRLDAEAAESALGRLPVRQREIVVLRIWGELSFPEIAGLVERPLSSVFMDYRDALASLKQLLEMPCRKT
jgi:RNA polymerase sigma-70 factor (ECF subfamily)